MFIHRTGLLATALSLASLSGCAAAPFGQLPHAFFAVGQEESAIDVAARPSRMGELRVNLQSVLAQLKKRRVLSTIADVDHVVVTVTPTGAAAVTQTVSKTAIASGQTTATFTGLPVGAAEVSVTAFNADGVSIGTTSAKATIASGQTATLNLNLTLNPTYMPPASGGGTGSTTGGLTTNVTLTDGPVVHAAQAGDVVGTYELGFAPYQVAVDAQGNAWVTGSKDLGGGVTEGRLAQVAPDGTVLRSIPFGETCGAIAINETGHLWVVVASANGNSIYELDATGTPVGSHDNPEVLAGFFSAVDAQGNWMGSLANGAGFQTMSPSGQFGQFLGLNTPSLTLGAHQDLWAANAQYQLVHYTQAKALLSATTLSDGYVCGYTALDPLGNVWASARHATDYAKPGRIYKFDGTGTQLAAYTLSASGVPTAIAVAPNGVVWTLAGGITRLSPAGTELSVTPLPIVGTPGVHMTFAVGQAGAWVLKDDGTQQITLVAP